MKTKKLITVIAVVCVLSVLLAIPAFATVTERNGDGYALYNGVKLPNINSVWTDNGTYLCAFTYRYDGDYVLVLSSSPFSQEYRGSAFFYENYSDGLVYILRDGVWVLESTFNVNTTPSFWRVECSDLSCLWTSKNISNVSSNEIVVLETDPIPLDGYNVIEWDGDTTGLASNTAGTIFKVSEFFTVPSSSYVTINSSNLLHVGSNIIANYYGDSGWAVGSYILQDAAIGYYNYSYIDNGVYLVNDGNRFTQLFAYRTAETPPDEGGGDIDEPQPPCGVADM